MNEIGRPNNLDSHWMPFTANRTFKQAPRMLARAKGMFYYWPEDRETHDGALRKEAA